MTTILAQIKARAAKAADFMSTVNRMPAAAALAVMRADAGHKHAAFPQYRGKWDNHKIRTYDPLGEDQDGPGLRET